MCVLCMIYVDWELGGRKKLVRVGLQETNNFFLGLIPYQPCSNNEDLYQSIVGINKLVSCIFLVQSVFENTHQTFNRIIWSIFPKIS